MDRDENAAMPEQLATAGVVFGLVSLVVCWWFPFGPALALAGTAAGVGSWLGGGGLRSLVGLAFAASGFATGVLIAADSWWQTLPF
jgi:hypothetical protein